MDQEIRNKLRSVVTQCRRLLEESISQELEGKYGIFAKKDQVTADPNATMSHLSEEEQAARKDILDHFAHIEARSFKPKDALDQLVREIAFTHLNRLCAYKMMEAREVYIGGQKFREAVSRGVNSNGVKFYLAEHPEDERLFNTGHQDAAYRHFLDWLGGLLSEEIGVLFNPNDPANRLYPRQKTLDEVLDLLNGGSIKAEEIELREKWPKIWLQDETIGWVYQYFTPKELRDAARDPKRGGSQAPRNSYELAFRNQFFTPRYVVEFLIDNTLGRIWYEMRQGITKLRDQCRYLVRRPVEVFLNDGEQSPVAGAKGRDDLSQEELLKQPVHIPHRPKKDPRELKILDPASGSGHFLLYGFDLLLTIYEEAYTDPDLGPLLQKDYPKLDDLRRDVPRLILAHNLHGIDIDLRASQIAALALWLRCQRVYQDLGLKKDRPKISRSNFVCAEPMPGEEHILKEFVGQLEPKLLGQLVEVVFDKMRLAGIAGSLLKVEEELRVAITSAKAQWSKGPKHDQFLLFGAQRAAPDQMTFNFSGITDVQFFQQAEAKVVDALRSYSEQATNGHRLQRRLFSEDTARGFAFIDVCHKQFDVVVMNPPFGEPALGTETLLRNSYPEAYRDVFQCFVQRAFSLLSDHGIIGPLTSRTGFYLGGAKAWRAQLLDHAIIGELVDLGLDVLDTAMVQVAAYTLRAGQNDSIPSWFCRLLKVPAIEKHPRLCTAIDASVNGKHDPLVFGLRCQQFSNLPGRSFGYWLSDQLLSQLGSMKPSKDQGVEVRIGLQTSDDFRYLRNWWEISPNDANWIPFAKGGNYSPYYDDINLVAQWKNNGEEYWTPINPKIGKPYSNIWMLGETISRYFGKGGLTYPRRTSKKFNPRVLPTGCGFADKGPVIRWKDKKHELAFLAIAYSRIFEWIMTAQVGREGVDTRAQAISYEAGVLLGTPLPFISDNDVDRLACIGEELAVGAATPLITDEVSHCFERPFLRACDSIKLAADSLLRQEEDLVLRKLDLERNAEAIVNPVYGLIAKDVTELDEALLPSPTWYPNSADTATSQAFEDAYLHGASMFHREGDDDGEVSARGRFHADDIEGAAHLFKVHPRLLIEHRRTKSLLRRQDAVDATQRLLSWCMGVLFGRWNVYALSSEIPASAQPNIDVFKAISATTAGMLLESSASSIRRGTASYPVKVMWDGIAVDDAEQADDVVRIIRETLEVIWRERAEHIEKEACEIVQAKDLREYLRKPGMDGFWGSHVARYSKSRRKAPIYWLLQSSKKNFALWLYYHRLDKDLLFKALVNHVEPKIRLETSRLETLRGQKASAGESGKDAKRLAKSAEQQEDFLSELRDFEDKLRRAAKLHLEPDFNDGVVLNIALLHELVPWREAKNYWDELLEGKYEWSSIGKQLRQKGLVK